MENGVTRNRTRNCGTADRPYPHLPGRVHHVPDYGAAEDGYDGTDPAVQADAAETGTSPAGEFMHAADQQSAGSSLT